MKKRTRITIVTRRRVVAETTLIRCGQCGAEVPTVTAENAAALLQTSPEEINGLLANGELHVFAEPSGTKLICGNSLRSQDREHSDRVNTTSFEGETQ